MGANLHLEDVVDGHPVAQQELKDVEDECEALRLRVSLLTMAAKIALTNLDGDPNYPATRRVLSEAIKEQQ